jgi:hypothetical protein
MKSFSSCFAKAIPLLVTLASLATALMPNPSPREAELLATVHRILDVLALNVVHNSHQLNAQDISEDN